MGDNENQSTDREALAALYGNGKPFLFVVIAVQIAGGIDDIAELMRILVGRKKSPRRSPEPPPLDHWLKLYKKHRRLGDANFAVATGADDVKGSEAADVFRSMQGAPRDDVREAMQAIAEEDPNVLKQFLQMVTGVPFPPDIDTLRGMLEGMEAQADEGQDQGEPFDLFMHSLEGQFCFRVWLPCWILYKTYPCLLLRQAREGDDDALDKLLRLDKSVVADPVISKRWHAIMHGGAHSRRERFIKAMGGKVKGRIEKKSLRLAVSGLISQVAQAFQCDVTSSWPAPHFLFHVL